ncbi:YveK family protein [Candidatus Collinsella stercoripullorum]|uniref:YveK family protein n=1 Tax=Candidatus Collinsella stercoripullorum TaxID=2838522 RepID=UPI001C3A46E4|nr:Wzz/FepE/Etk N-terminal domain-containing protein [Candidatus Collinsella stercoripullorum]HJA01599.1 lipopolysaccharide biosynthesis protein [Candidatus Collinsella stercoripullorum]
MTLLELFQLLRKHLRLVVALPVGCALIMAVVSFALMGNTYTAQTSMYILANSNTESQSTNYTDLTASQLLANDVATLLQSDRVEADAASSLGLTDLSDYKVSVTSETTTRVISLVVTGPDPQGVADVANEMASQVSVVAQDVQMADSINVIDEAVAPTSPSGPNRMLYIAVAFLAGLFLAIAIVVLMDMLNTRIRSAEDAEELLGVPVVGRIPAMKKKGGK